MMRSIIVISILLIFNAFSGCKADKTKEDDKALNIKLNHFQSNEVKILNDSILLTSDPTSCKNSDIYWYKNGTLSQSNGYEWIEADELNRLSTCGGFLFEMSKRKGINPLVMSGDFIISSRSLMLSLDEFYGRSENKDIPFSNAAMLSMLK